MVVNENYLTEVGRKLKAGASGAECGMKGSTGLVQRGMKGSTGLALSVG